MSSPPLDQDDRPFVSVIVPVFDAPEPLAVLLRALGEQDYPAQRFECIVVDNGSAVPVRVAEDGALSVRVVREEQPGSYAARNRGLKEARGEVIAFTDSDCLPRPDWLSGAVRALGPAGQGRIVAGRIDVFSAAERPRSTVEWRGFLNRLDQERYVEKMGFGATANLVTRRDVFDLVGPFDAELYSSGDFEWCRRAAAQGIELVYCPDAVVGHPAFREWRAVRAHARRLTGGFYGRNRGRPRPARATLLQVLRIGRDNWRRIRSDPRVPGRALRLRLLALDLAVRGVQLVELLRLRLGGTPRR